MRKQIQYLILFFMSIAISQSAYGVIAYPFPVEITQPDGSIITIILKGDEHVKWAQTLDGFSILRNNKGVYEFATLNALNDMIPSGIKVKNLSERSLSDIAFLSKIKKRLIYSKDQIGIMKSISKMYQKSAKKTASTTGTRKLLCILMGFTDKQITKTKADFENLFNQVGYNTDGATGSVYDFYKENSWGQLDLLVTVAGPYVALNNMAFYGGNNSSDNDQNPKALVSEAVYQADADVNYADFDNDGDGVVDGIYVIYAGHGEEAGGGADAIWAHAWSISPLTLDGKSISRYSCSAELRGSTGSGMTRIGVICHEFGHVLGAADYYDTNYATDGSYDGTGDWDIMASGSWNNNGATPAHHNPFTKIYDYGWSTATTLASDANFTLHNAELNKNSFYRVNTATPNEFFLLENRQQQLFDNFIPGHGMVIYHVDGDFISTSSNDINAGAHQGMFPINAIGDPPAFYGVINSKGLPFPGTSNVKSFTDLTSPSSLSWLGENTNKPITNIIETTTSKTIYFSFMGGVTCIPPTTQSTSFISSSITGYSMNIGWSRGNGDKVMVVVKEGSSVGIDPYDGITYVANSIFGSGDEVGTGIFAVYNGTGNSVIVTGLKPGMIYYYAIYEYSNTSCYLTPSLTGNVETTCVTISSFPYSENFESEFLSSCWSEEFVTGSLHWQILKGNGITNPTNAHSGVKNLCFKNQSTSASITRLVLSAFNLSTLTNPSLRFWHTQDISNTDQDELRLYYKTSTTGTWTLLKIFANIITDWTKEEVLLPNSSSDYYIAFEGTAKNGFGVSVDDIEIYNTELPSLTTTIVSNITANTGTSGGNVTSDGGSSISKKGVCWSIAENPTISNAKTSNGSGVGSFVSNISGLISNTLYHVRAYATNIAGTTYGQDITFNTIGTGIDDNSQTVNYLSQNYPNPFDQTTTIDFTIVKPGRVYLSVFNTLGREVDVIVDEYISAGTYSKRWTPKGITAGIYFYQLKAYGINETKLLIKK